jgi:hypothetical protein
MSREHRPAPRQGRELAKQRLEERLALALRAKMKVAGRVRQRQELGEQIEFVFGAQARSEQFAQFSDFLLSDVRSSPDSDLILALGPSPHLRTTRRRYVHPKRWAGVRAVAYGVALSRSLTCFR